MNMQSQAKNFQKNEIGTHANLNNKYKVLAIRSGVMNTKLAFGLRILYSSSGDRNSLQCGQFMLNKYVIVI